MIRSVRSSFLRKLSLCSASALAAALYGCDGGGNAKPPATIPDVVHVDPSSRSIDLVRPEDQNPDPHVFEFDLEARVAEVELADGHRTSMYTFNGSIPGPLVEVNVGDRIVVHFRNMLPDTTTIHWHGLRLPVAMDGSPLVMSPIAARGGTFTYEFTVRDAGLFWYHPHVASAEQVERGLYGAILVHGPGEPTIAKERVLMFDDVLVDSNWGLVDFAEDQGIGGRQGNLMIVNGVARPTISIRPGERQRWRIVNTSNARYLQLSLPGHTFIQLGTDGGLLEAPVERDKIFLVPGERMDVVVTGTGAAGSTVDVVSEAYERGRGTGLLPQPDALRLTYTTESPATPEMIPTTLRTIAPPAEPVRQRNVRLQVIAPGALPDAGPMMPTDPHSHGNFPPLFMINGVPFGAGSTPLQATLGTTETWYVTNETSADHPFHIHGFFFQVLSRNDVPETRRAWEDTVNVKAGQSMELAMMFDGFPGRWMFHCHILEHAERGMLAEVEVHEPASP